MDDARRTSVRNALQRFRETVTEHNFHVLRILVEGMVSQPTPVNMSAEWAEARRLDVFNKYLGVDVTKFAATPQDLLDDRLHSDMVSLCRMDGTAHQPIDSTRRADWFDAIRAEIAQRNITIGTFPPPCLEFLLTLTSGIHGPGLHWWRQMKQFDLVSPQSPLEQAEITRHRVIVPMRDDPARSNDLTFVWEDWEIAVALKIGDGPRSWGGSYALYCRNPSNEAWKWRYGVHDEEWCSDVYDNLESYLEFYAHFREQSEQQARRAVKDLSSLR